MTGAMRMSRLSTFLFATVLLALTAFRIMPSAGAQQSDSAVFELRTYTATPGNLDALLDRFRDHTVRIFEKHGMTNVGYWVPNDPELSGDTLIYLLRHDSREAADASWQAFISDPEWQRVAEASNADGPILASVERVFMTATGFSELQ